MRIQGSRMPGMTARSRADIMRAAVSSNPPTPDKEK